MVSPTIGFRRHDACQWPRLFTGGFDGKAALASSEIYDAATTLSSPGPPLLFPRRHHTAIRPAGVNNVLIFGDTRGSSARAHVRPTAGAELFMPALNQFLSARELAAADANGKPPAHIETHVTVAELDWEGDLRDVRFYLLTPDKAAANTEAK